LATLFLCIRDLAITIRPIVPSSADKLLEVMGIGPDARDQGALQQTDWYVNLAQSEYRLSAPTPIFPRLELPEDEEEAAA